MANMHPNAFPSWMERARSGLGGVTLLAALLVGIPLQADAAEEQTAAVLKRHELDFTYRSSVAPMSCTELQGRVASVFRALGAREDVEVRVTNCAAVITPDMPGDDWSGQSDPWRSSSDPFETSSDRWRTGSDRFRDRRTGREQTSYIRVSLMMPVEVTPEVLEEIKRDKSRRELVSRVTGDPSARMDEPIVFPAQRQPVTLSRRTLDLEPHECELLDQMSTTALRELGMKVVSRPRCDRRRISHIPPQLTVEALMPVMPSVPQFTPDPSDSESEGEKDPSG